MSKTCKRCGEQKSLSDFYKAKTNKDGYFGACKSCVILRVADYRARNLEKVRACNRRSNGTPSAKAALASRSMDNREKYPERHAARVTLRNAVRAGKVIKPTTCSYSACPEEEKFLIEAHHEDYAYPLIVEWLCIPCHGRLHRGNTPAARAIQAVIAVP